MRPVALVIDDDAAGRRAAARLFASVGWDVVEVAAGDWAAIGEGAMASLVLCAAAGMPPAPTVAALRAHPAIREAPIVAWIAAGSDEAAMPGCDDVLDKAAGPVGMAALAQRWHPDDPGAVLDRLATAIGQEEIAAMTQRLGVQLAAALAVLSTTDHPDEAHRIAGIAGMLGFDELGAAWLAVSRGAAGAAAPARIATRRALATLARRCGEVSCSAARP